jgi:cytochrome c553
MAPPVGGVVILHGRGAGADVALVGLRAARFGAATLAAVLLLVTSGGAAAADVKAGRAKAVMCQACHGLDGMSKVPDAPNIAGQNPAYLVTQLRAFKSGARKNEAMTVVASTLSDQEMEDLAAYFAAIEIKVGALPGG